MLLQFDVVDVVFSVYCDLLCAVSVVSWWRRILIYLLNKKECHAFKCAISGVNKQNILIYASNEQQQCYSQVDVSLLKYANCPMFVTCFNIIVESKIVVVKLYFHFISFSRVIVTLYVSANYLYLSAKLTSILQLSLIVMVFYGTLAARPHLLSGTDVLSPITYIS